ncbi:Guanine nucleotide-binding protein-like 3 [Globomyces sp. JEL0801]|nr:Guanine nucleotide-binding protein-like 3 [Globomyces sp. JEL0801]
MARGDYRKRNIKADWVTIPISKKNDSSPGTSKKAKKKDPGIPDLRKYSAKLTKLHQQKAALKPTATATTFASDQDAMAHLAQKAAARSTVFNLSLDTVDNAFNGVDQGDAAAIGKKDNSKKAYYREFKKVVEQADVILEILDARDPIGCRTKEVEEMILNAGADKKIILILNKIDLVPRDVVEQWLKHLRNEYPCIAFKASTQSQRSNLGQSNVSASLATDALLSGSESVGADNLIKLLKNYCRNVNIKTAITVGVVGFPNLTLKGVTKVAQTIHLDKNINLLDCPGIVFSQSSRKEDAAQVLLRNCVKVELLDDPISPVDLILSRCSIEQLENLYQIKNFNDTNSFLVQYAQARGKLLKGGVPDIENAARSIIQDWNQGRIPFYTVPPVQTVDSGAHVSSAIVTGWAKEFSLDDLTNDSEVLNSVEPQSYGAIPMESDSMIVESEMVEEPMLETMPQQRLDSSIPEIRFKPVVKKTVVVEKKEELFTRDEALINPIFNSQISKKQQKKQKKQARRLQKLTDMEQDEGFDDEDVSME